MKILITSDNHLGYKENDDIRGDDSFNTFEEILMISKHEKVDFIIQGGDLFHDNRPTRYCIDKTIKLLNKYCTGREQTKHRELLRLNKMADNVSISMPILAIHGNHDDPSGINQISTLNILHSAGLINYIGHYSAEKIVVDPIIVKNIAIYGIGHIKDKILYSSIIEGRVVFNKPKDHKKYYSILVLHQNRVSRNKEYIPESLFDGEFDLIVYGHEHDNNITKGKSIVLQSGSTVRTSLCESETGEKYCYILEVNRGPPPTVNKIKLYTVRNFIMETVKLESDNIEKAVTEYLQKMIEKSNQEFESKRSELNRPQTSVNQIKRPKLSLTNGEDGNTTRIIEEPLVNNPVKLITDDLKLPLIRLRVETTGLKVLNNHKLGLKFKNAVANANEMVRFIRKRTVNNTKTGVISSNISICEMIRLNMHYLGAILEESFIESLENFTSKDDKEAFNNLITSNTDRIVAKIDLSKILIDDLENEIKRINKEEKRKEDNIKFKAEAVQEFNLDEDNIYKEEKRKEDNIKFKAEAVQEFNLDEDNIYKEEKRKEDNIKSKAEAVQEFNLYEDNIYKDTHLTDDDIYDKVHLESDEFCEDEQSTEIPRVDIDEFRENVQTKELPRGEIDENLEKKQQEVQSDTFTSLSFISDTTGDKESKLESSFKINTSVLVSSEKDSIKEKINISETKEKYLFCGKNSKEARKMLNSMNSESKININCLDDTLKDLVHVETSVVDDCKTTNAKRVLFETEDKSKDEEDDKFDVISLDESSTDLLFDF